MSNKKTIQYSRVGDYLIPNPALPAEEASVTLGKWGMLHKDYLLKHQKWYLQLCSQKETAAVSFRY